MKLTREYLDQFGTDKLIDFCYGQLKLKKEDVDALKFTNALIQIIEEQLTRQLIELFKARFVKTSKPDVMESHIRDLGWRKKIDILETIDNKRFKSLVSFSRKMNDIRNKVFHAKFYELKYDGTLVSDIGTQRKMFFDFIKANMID